MESCLASSVRSFSAGLARCVGFWDLGSKSSRRRGAGRTLSPALGGELGDTSGGGTIWLDGSGHLHLVSSLSVGRGDVPLA